METSQFKLFRLLAANCFAVKHYSAAERPSRSFIPEALTKEFISHLPAQAVPQIGGDEFATRSGKTLEHHENSLNVSGTNEYAATVVLGDGMEIDYIVMARGDFDGDDVEDLILRLDRNIPEAFGSGFSAIAISRTSDSGEIKIVSRYPD